MTFRQKYDINIVKYIYKEKNMSNNPLMQFARHAELSTKLASNPNWYPEGFIQYTLNGEVEVYPMLPKDELMLYNPDALLSGQAIVSIIKSCCPSILNPEKLYFPDSNILLLAIKKATYGNDHKQSIMCPECAKKIEKLKSPKTSEKEKKEIEKLLKDGKITDHEEEHIYEIDKLLSSISYLKDEYEITIDGLTYNLRPYTLKVKEYYSLISLQRSKLLKMYNETIERTEEISNEEKEATISKINDIQMTMINANNEIITEGINFIKMPDDSIINDKTLIKEFIDNCKSEIITKLTNELAIINDIGLPKEVPCVCSFCNHEWETPLSGFNQTDFFE